MTTPVSAPVSAPVPGSARATSPPSARRYLALFLPWLPAERPAQTGAAPPEAPLALIEKERGALRIVATCRRAAALGLVPGM
ncbi:hypothetical protein ABTN00_20385, partial [Acinetobacter baumannii]